MRWNVLSLIYAMTLAFTTAQVSAQTNTISPPLVNPANNHTYQLLKSADFTTSAQWAKEMGGHLVWIENQAEQDWVFQTFANFQGPRLLWLGLTLNEHVKDKLQYLWSNGEAPSYTNWFPGEPNNAAGNEKYVAMFYPGFNSPGKWNDWGNVANDPAGVPFSGVVEFDNTILNKKGEGLAVRGGSAPAPRPNVARAPTNLPHKIPVSPLTRSTPQLNPTNGHWYQVVVSDKALTWPQAKAAAEGMKYEGISGHLTTITSSAEQQFVINQVPDGSNFCWLGASQASNAREPDGDWKWVTGEPWSFTNWDVGEPNNAHQPFGFDEDALKMTPKGGWNDSKFNATSSLFIVEFEPLSATTTRSVDKLQIDDNKTFINLPAPVDDVVLGRGGQLLILWIRKLQKLAIFDTAEKRIVKYLSVPSDDVKFAAGAEKLIVVLNDQHIMQRWDLRSLERELTMVAPEGGPVHSMAMGYASNGPLMIVNGPTAFYDPSTMKSLDVDMKFARFYAWGSANNDQLQIRASGDGSTFSAWRTGNSYNVIMTLRVSVPATGITANTGGQSYLIPDFDGSRFFPDFLNTELKPVAPDRFRNQYLVPFYGGEYFMALSDKNRTGRGWNDERTQNKLTPQIYSEGDAKLLITLPEMEELTAMKYPRLGLTFDKRLFVLPDAQLIVSIPDSKDKLVLRRFNLVEELKKSNIDYLLVTSRPLITAQQGRQYNYQIETLSKGGRVQFSLESGVPGMTLYKSGKLQWTVPADYPGKEENIIISITDASGQQIYHTFKIAVTSQNPQPQSPRLAPSQLAFL